MKVEVSSQRDGIPSFKNKKNCPYIRRAGGNDGQVKVRPPWCIDTIAPIPIIRGGLRTVFRSSGYGKWQHLPSYRLFQFTSIFRIVNCRTKKTG